MRAESYGFQDEIAGLPLILFLYVVVRLYFLIPLSGFKLTNRPIKFCKRKKMMKAKKYSTHFAKLSNLILSMSEEQQAKLLDLTTRVQKGKNLFESNGIKNASLLFTAGILAGWGLVTLLFLILSAT